MLEENFFESSLGFPFNLNLSLDSSCSPPLLSPCKFVDEMEISDNSSSDRHQYNRIDELLARLSNVESEPFNLLLSQQSQSSQYSYFDYSDSVNGLLNNLSPSSPFHLSDFSTIKVKEEPLVVEEIPMVEVISFGNSNSLSHSLELIQIDTQKSQFSLMDSFPQHQQQPQQYMLPQAITMANHQQIPVCHTRTMVEPKLTFVPSRTPTMSRVGNANQGSRTNRSNNASSTNISGGRLSNKGARSSTEIQKRSNHNSLERRRREDLREMLNCLRRMIPQLTHNDRSSKVVILEKSMRYIDDLLAREYYLDEKLRKSRRRAVSLALRLREKFGLFPSKRQ